MRVRLIYLLAFFCLTLTRVPAHSMTTPSYSPGITPVEILYEILGALVAAIFAIVMGSMASKQDRSDKKAHAAKLLGWITLGLIALLLILAAIIVATFSWY